MKHTCPFCYEECTEETCVNCSMFDYMFDDIEYEFETGNQVV